MAAMKTAFGAGGGAAIRRNISGVPATRLSEIEDVVIGAAGNAEWKAGKSGSGGRYAGRLVKRHRGWCVHVRSGRGAQESSETHVNREHVVDVVVLKNSRTRTG